MSGPAPTMQSCFVLVDCSSGMPFLLIPSVEAPLRSVDSGMWQNRVRWFEFCARACTLKGNVSYGFRIGDEFFS